jgi:hypothetical protein
MRRNAGDLHRELLRGRQPVDAAGDDALIVVGKSVLSVALGAVARHH